MKNKKLYILTFIIVVAIASVCIPVLAKNNNSYYANRVTGDSLYVAAGNIGNVEADADVNIPINIGGSDYEAHGIRLTIEYEPEYFEFVSISLGDNVKCGTNNPFRMFNDETN